MLEFIPVTYHDFKTDVPLELLAAEAAISYLENNECTEDEKVSLLSQIKLDLEQANHELKTGSVVNSSAAVERIKKVNIKVNAFSIG